MKAIYYTDDRTGYQQGSYYLDWLNGFKDLLEVEVAMNLRASHLWGHELMVFGHGYIDYNRSLHAGGGGGRHTVLDKVMKKAGFNLPYAKARLFGGKKLFLSKNDYKSIPEKKALANYMKVDMVVTHTKAAVDGLRGSYQCVWCPFGVDTRRYIDLRGERDIGVGFIGNAHLNHIGDIRMQFAEKLMRPSGTWNSDIRVNRPDENLLGSQYIQWLNRCRLVMCTSSAMGTVGTRFFEAMACGAVPLAPVEDYEGLLVPDLHYVPVKHDLSDVDAQIERFIQDKAYRGKLLEACRKFVDAHDVRVLAGNLLAGLGLGSSQQLVH